MTTWKPPPENTLKINVDGSTKDSGLSTIGIVIRNHKSEVVNYRVTRCGVSTAIKTETLAIRDSLVLAKELKLEKKLWKVTISLWSTQLMEFGNVLGMLKLLFMISFFWLMILGQSRFLTSSGRLMRLPIYMRSYATSPCREIRGLIKSCRLSSARML